MRSRLARRAAAGVLFVIPVLACGDTRITVAGPAMQPTLEDGQVVIGSPVEGIARGDIVGFRYPRDTSKSFVMRVVGLPGERIASRGGHVVIDGQVLEEPYLAGPATRYQNWGPIELPADAYFMMGDNRDTSSDSRSWGPVPRALIWTQVNRPAEPGPSLSAASPFLPAGPAQLYGCDMPDGASFTFTVHPGDARVLVKLPEAFGGREVDLPRDASAPGSRYDADDVLFWVNEGRVRLDVDDRTFTCAQRPDESGWDTAGSRGVTFRAVGQEPGWYLEIIPDRWIHFAHDYAQKHAFTVVPEPTRADGRRTWRAETDAHTLEILVEDRPCSDVMSGQPFEATVTVTLDGDTYRGCGRAIG